MTDSKHLSDEAPRTGMLPGPMARCEKCGDWSYWAALTADGLCLSCAKAALAALASPEEP